jgi:rubredoxin
MSDREPEQDRPGNPVDEPAQPDIKPSKKAIIAADDDRFECRACGHIYNPDKGEPKNRIIAGTPFTALPDTWKCPACGAKQIAFTNIGTNNNASGFKENMTYGFGVNTMTAEQKSLLIYGGLGLGILLFLSLYTLS